jgi:hypothetical protein
VTADHDHRGELDGILGELEAAAESGEALTAAEMLSVIGARGFGPVLVVLSVFLILPVGMTPGLPAVVAVILALIGLMMLIGRKRLHLPERIGRLSLASRRIVAVTRRVRPYTARLHGVLRPRLEVLANSRPAFLAIGLILIGTALVLFFIGFIPFLPFVLALHVLLLGLGLSARDGLAVLAALVLVVPEAMLVLQFV